MPTLNLSTNVPVDAVVASDILKDATKIVAKIIGKPESYVMILLNGGVPMAFGGSEEPAAYGELVSIGGLTPTVNGKLSTAITGILETKLSIDSSRNAQPRFQFIVMNRHNTDNLVKDMLGDFEFEIHVPYLLYRNGAHEVNGIWFYNQKECEAVADLLSSAPCLVSMVQHFEGAICTCDHFHKDPGGLLKAVLHDC